jgi:hypothetical protein
MLLTVTSGWHRPYCSVFTVNHVALPVILSVICQGIGPSSHWVVGPGHCANIGVVVL